MRIAQCLEYPLFDPGGVEVLVLEMVRRLHDRDVETLLVSPCDLTTEQRSLLPGIKEVFVWNRSVNPSTESRRLAEWLQRHHADLAHFHMGTFGWNARSWSGCPIPHIARAGISCVSTNHGAFTLFDAVAPYRPLWFKLLSLPPFWLAKLRQLAHVQWEATVSQHDQRAMRRWFFPARGKFLQLYHSKLRGDEFTGKADDCSSRIPDEAFVLCLGTIGARKGQQYLVEAFLKISSRHPDWRLILAGRQAHEPTVALIRQLIDSSAAGHRVLLMENVDDSEAKTLLRRSGIFAIPSTAEGLGLSLQEALYAGCACIGSQVGGIPDLIEHEKTGLLVRPADVESLANGLERLMNEEAMRKHLGEEGRKSMEERGMTARKMTESYLKLYRETLELVKRHA